VLFVFIVTWLIRIPILQLVAGVALVWVAWKLVCPQEEALDAAAHPEQAKKHSARSLWHAVQIIVIADVIMSLDNVIAIAGIAKEGSTSSHGEMWLVTFGLLVSIPIVIWGSALMSNLMNHYRWIVWLGGGVLAMSRARLFSTIRKCSAGWGYPRPPGCPELKWTSCSNSRSQVWSGWCVACRGCWPPSFSASVRGGVGGDLPQLRSKRRPTRHEREPGNQASDTG